jgi:hypothetical protein
LSDPESMLRAPPHPLDPHTLKAMRMQMLKLADVAHAERPFEPPDHIGRASPFASPKQDWPQKNTERPRASQLERISSKNASGYHLDKTEARRRRASSCMLTGVVPMTRITIAARKRLGASSAGVRTLRIVTFGRRLMT